MSLKKGSNGKTVTVPADQETCHPSLVATASIHRCHPRTANNEYHLLVASQLINVNKLYVITGHNLFIHMNS
jgi:hypothetical protein